MGILTFNIFNAISPDNTAAIANSNGPTSHEALQNILNGGALSEEEAAQIVDQYPEQVLTP